MTTTAPSARTSLTTLFALVTVAALFVFGGSAPGDPRAGCLWDSDTLRTEATGAPGLVETIVGRFDRYPPLYYEMRLERVATELDADPADHPKNLAAYDDAGVACDRLGRHDEAIEWMSRKRTALDALPASEERTEHEYRYLANLGTFHAHRWIAAGADRSDMADIERARDLIAQAIELNPDAHFGRERYQLMALEWILEPPESWGYYGEDENGATSFLQADPNLPAAVAEIGDLAARKFAEARDLIGQCEADRVRPAAMMMEAYERIFRRMQARGWHRVLEPSGLSKAEKLWVAVRYGLL